MTIPPLLDDQSIATQLRSLKQEMSILKMERLSGVNRQVLYRIMGGTSINRSPYEIVIKVLLFLDKHGIQDPVQVVTLKAPVDQE